jgi:hypothetical protein
MEEDKGAAAFAWADVEAQWGELIMRRKRMRRKSLTMGR